MLSFQEPDWLTVFITESNRIEGINRRPTQTEIAAHGRFLESGCRIGDVVDFVSAIAPGHVLRDEHGLNVRVGSHIAPPGGPAIKHDLEELLEASQSPTACVFEAHRHYENLHPFTDGNGRSGRAIWLWMMLRREGRAARMARELGFLHTFYYQALSASDGRNGRTQKRGVRHDGT